MSQHIDTLGVQCGVPSLTLARQGVADLAAEFLPACIKVGITCDPQARFFNIDYGYVHEGWMAMRVLHAGTTDQAVWLETNLIASLWGTSGLKNDSPGGENPGKSKVCFTYSVAVRASSRELKCFKRRKVHL